MFGLLSHETITSDLGEDRGGGDRQAAGVAPHDASSAPAADEVPVAVDQHCRWLPEAEAVDRSSGGQLLRGRHAELVALLLACMAHAPGDAPLGKTVEEPFALAGAEHLGIAHLVHPAVGRQHRGADGERPRPRAPAHLVHPDYDGLTVRPQRPFAVEAGNGLGHRRRQ